MPNLYTSVKAGGLAMTPVTECRRTTSLPTSCGFNLYFQAVFKGFQRIALLNQGVEGRNNERFFIKITYDRRKHCSRRLNRLRRGLRYRLASNQKRDATYLACVPKRYVHPVPATATNG